MKTLVAITIATVTILSLPPPTGAATAPGTADRKRSAAKEVFEVKVTKVYLEETEGNFKDVLMEATVTKVVRTSCGVKDGNSIIIKSRRRNMTAEQLRGSMEAFSEAPLLIRKGWSGAAYLRSKNTTDSVKTFGVVLEGFSFVKK